MDETPDKGPIDFLAKYLKNTTLTTTSLKLPITFQILKNTHEMEI